MADVKSVPVSADCTVSISSTGLNVSDYTEIRAFLLNNLTDFVPVCEEAVYDKTASFEGEWADL